jgi:putative endonuclease
MNLGSKGEQLVASHYQRQGYRLLEQNYIFRTGRQVGEIDLILQKDREIVFVEVKARRNNKFGGPFEAVDFFKQRKLVKTAKLYLKQHPHFQAYSMRIDVAGVDIDNTEEPVIILTNAIEDLD